MATTARKRSLIGTRDRVLGSIIHRHLSTVGALQTVAQKGDGGLYQGRLQLCQAGRAILDLVVTGYGHATYEQATTVALNTGLELSERYVAGCEASRELFRETPTMSREEVDDLLLQAP